MYLSAKVEKVETYDNKCIAAMHVRVLTLSKAMNAAVKCDS